MKRGEVIDPNSAMKIAGQFSSTEDGYQVRPVIWPKRLIETVMQNPPDRFTNSKPKRPLVHLLCLENEIRWISATTTIDPYTVEIGLGDADYDGNLKDKGGFCLYYEDRNFFKRIRAANPHAAQNAVNLKAMFDAVQKAQDVSQRYEQDGFQLYLMAYLLEFYAFSPFTSSKLKPVFRGGFSNKPIPKEWPVVEIVNLRMPEKTDSPESTGHRKFKIQFPVSSHFRRLVGKDGTE